MEPILEWLAQTDIATYFRNSRWGFAAANTAHIFGISILFGSVLTLDLRLLGLWRKSPLAPFSYALPRIAAVGLALAIITGLLLFSVRPSEYAALGIFRIKLALICLGFLAALLAHARGSLHNDNRRQQMVTGAVSIFCWAGALICGRLIAFMA